MIVIEVSQVEMFRQRKMRLAAVWTQSAQRLNRRIGQRQPCRSVVGTDLIDQVVSARQFVIDKKKRRIAFDCFVKQSYSFEKILAWSCATILPATSLWIANTSATSRSYRSAQRWLSVRASIN